MKCAQATITQFEALIHRAKLTIGCHFLLKKLGKLKSSTDATSRSLLAQDCLDKIDAKGIVVSKALMACFQKFAAAKPASAPASAAASASASNRKGPK